MSRLLIMRGLPASGKSTFAKEWVAEDRATRVRVNRDDLRMMIHDGFHLKGVTELTIIKARDLLILGLLKAGKDVVVDDTNLPSRTMRDLLNLGRRAGAIITVEDLTHVPLEVCIDRDAKRYDGANSRACVGEDVIRQMHQAYIKGKESPLPVPELAPVTPDVVVPYEANETLAKVVLVDLDGTMALMNGRGAYEWHRVDEDLPNTAVIQTVEALHAAGFLVVFASGRDGSCCDKTVLWLEKHLSFQDWDLYMRPEGDMRKDSIVKLEIFNNHIRNRYNVQMVLDDRDQVVELWRSLGIPCFQVAPGAF